MSEESTAGILQAVQLAAALLAPALAIANMISPSRIETWFLVLMVAFSVHVIANYAEERHAA